MHNSGDDPNLIGTAQVARILGRDVSTINRWCQLGKLTPGVKLDGPTGARLFDRAEIEALAQEVAA